MEVTRREFLMGTAGFIATCGAGYAGWTALNCGQSPSAASPGSNSAILDELQDVGPRLAGGITLVAEGLGASAYSGEQLLFTANQSGRALLEAADGTKSFAQIAEQAGLGESNIHDVVSFFTTLSDAGFLEQPFEVSLVEARF